MTQILQALGVAPTNGLRSGLQTSVTKGPVEDPLAVAEGVAALAGQLGLSAEQLSPELEEHLRAWLLGGIGLPLEGESLPPGQEFAGVLAASLRGSPKAVELLNAGLPGNISLPLGETPAKSLLVGAVQAALGGSGAQVSAFDKLPSSLPVGLEPELSTPHLLKDTVLAAAKSAIQEMPSLSMAQTLVANPEMGRASAQTAFSPILANNLLAMSVPQRVGAGDWGQAVGERLMWMVKGDQQLAELKITPPNLGPLEVKLTINNDQASVTFLSNHAAVRDALEAAIPRLREMMAQDSLNLVNVDVGANRQQSQSQTGETGGRGLSGSGVDSVDDGDTDGEQPLQTHALQSGSGLVDMFV
jgi:flagellar hook-length control protein FliK